MAERVWNTHVYDYSGRWWYSIEYFACSSACERPPVVECFICCWVGLEERPGQVEHIVIGGFESRYDPENMKKKRTYNQQRDNRIHTNRILLRAFSFTTSEMRDFGN